MLLVVHCWRDCDTVNRSVKCSPSVVSGVRGCSSSTELESGVAPPPCPGRMSIYGMSQSPPSIHYCVSAVSMSSRRGTCGLLISIKTVVAAITNLHSLERQP